MADSLIELVYVSRSVELQRGEDLQELLDEARSFNRAHDITGMLLYRDQSFLQVLEGPRCHVEPLYERIGNDRRHFRVQTLLHRALPRRRFPDWSMAFRHLELVDARIPRPTGYSRFLESGSTERFDDATEDEALSLLEMFREAG